MRKFIALVVFFALFSISAPVLALDAPTLTVTTSGVNVTLSWTSVPGATGYTLFYAPYPDASTIGQIDMGTQTNISFDGNGLAFYVAIQAYNISGSSAYSNIEFFNIEYSVYNLSTNNPGVWRISKIDYDSDNDGNIDDVRTFTYNMDGNYLKEDLSSYTRYYTYNDAGKKIKIDWYNTDGTPNRTISYSYDTYGNMVESHQEAYNYSNYTDNKTFYTVDAYGNYSQEKTYSMDNGILGDLSQQKNYYYDMNNYSYDSNNQPIKIEDDYNAGSPIERVYYFTYNSSGYVVKREKDYDNDGTIEYSLTTTFDSEGNLVSGIKNGATILFLSYDTAPQVKIDLSWELNVWDVGEDAFVGLNYVKNYRYPSKVEEDTSGDGLIDQVAYFTFDSNDMVEKIEYDNNNDGTIDAVEYNTWIK